MYRTHDNPWYQIKAWADFKASGGVEKQAVASWRLPNFEGEGCRVNFSIDSIPGIGLSYLSLSDLFQEFQIEKKNQRIPRRGQNALPYLHGPSKHQLLEVPPASWAQQKIDPLDLGGFMPLQVCVFQCVLFWGSFSHDSGCELVVVEKHECFLIS